MDMAVFMLDFAFTVVYCEGSKSICKQQYKTAGGNMKLNVGQTIRVGFAFLSICAFWQMYNNIVPLLLTNTFHLEETYSGAIMAMDNVLALFLLPLFGMLSDRCRHPLGRRMPFIKYGTIAAVIIMMFIPIIDNIYAVRPAHWLLIAFIAVLGILLVTMGTYRSPAVALMPDVTPKPLRSKANAIINLMGAVGGIIYLIVAAVLYSQSRTEGLSHVNYLPLFIVVGAIMIISMLIVLFTVNEPDFVARAAAYEKQEEGTAEEDFGGTERTGMSDSEESGADGETMTGTGSLSGPVRKSLVFLLASVAFWFISYNAVETWFTTYAGRMWNMSLGSASLCLTIATVGAILTYIPSGNIASRVGRKKTILGGVAIMMGAFAASFAATMMLDSFHPALYVIFAMIGIGWAAINTNSFPMVVEMCKGRDVGKFTGMYYTFSMAAQIVTPIVAGWVMNHVSYNMLFPYSFITITIAFVTMHFVKHGDSKVIEKRGLEAFDVDD